MDVPTLFSTFGLVTEWVREGGSGPGLLVSRLTSRGFPPPTPTPMSHSSTSVPLSRRVKRSCKDQDRDFSGCTDLRRMKSAWSCYGRRLEPEYFIWVYTRTESWNQGYE